MGCGSSGRWRRRRLRGKGRRNRGRWNRGRRNLFGRRSTGRRFRCRQFTGRCGRLRNDGQCTRRTIVAARTLPAHRRHHLHHAVALGTGQNLPDHRRVSDDQSGLARRAVNGEEFHGQRGSGVAWKKRAARRSFSIVSRRCRITVGVLLIWSFSRFWQARNRGAVCRPVSRRLRGW